MRLEYKSRTGKFNFANPSEESVSCHIAIYDNDGNKIKSTNVHPEYEEEGNDVDDAIYLLEESDKKVMYSSYQKEWREMIGFLKEHQEEIEEGNRQYRIQKIKKQIASLNSELDLLTNKT